MTESEVAALDFTQGVYVVLIGDVVYKRHYRQFLRSIIKAWAMMLSQKSDIAFILLYTATNTVPCIYFIETFRETDDIILPFCEMITNFIVIDVTKDSLELIYTRAHTAKVSYIHKRVK